MPQLIFPFALGLLLVLAQPVIDLVCEGTLRTNRYDDRSIEAARWAGATAAFLPAAVLTAYGALLVMWDQGREDADWVLMGAVLLLVTSFLLFLYAISRGGPAQSWRKGPTERFKYTFLQLVLGVLNVLGILLVVWYHLNGAPVEPTPRM